MKRWIWAILATGLLSIAGRAALAEAKPDSSYEGRLARRHEELSRKSRTEQLRLERARRRANERMNREEMFERIGYSPQRPVTPLSAMSFGSMGGPYSSWGNFGRPPSAR